MSSKMWALMLLSLLALALPSKAHAICYCTCTTASGSTCTVSIPDLACNGTGNSRCTRPTEPCRYDCSLPVPRPSSCSALRRCSVRN
jgi:hypothetical protein